MKISATRISRFSALKALPLLAAFFLTASINIFATATLDTTFGTNGRVAITPFSTSQPAAAVATQNNGKVIVIGNLSNNESGQDGLILRYNQNGTPDASFGDSGKVILSAASRSYNLYGVAVQAGGKIIAVGRVSPNAGSSNTDFLVARFNENGSFDNSFGNGGLIIANQGSFDSFRAVRLQPDGKIVAVGGTSDAGGRGAVFRFNQDGTYDTSFGGGFVLIDFPFSTSELFTSLDFYPNGRILLGGEKTEGTGSGSRGGFVTLLEPNGAAVQNFGINGFIRTYLSTNYNSQTKVRVLTNDKFVVGGGSLSLHTGSGVMQSELFVGYFGGFTLLSNGNLAIVTRPNQYLDFRGIRIYNQNLRLVGNDEKGYSAGDFFSGSDVAVSSNDKIVILRNDEVIRLNGVTSYATRVIHFDEDKKTDIGVYRPSNYTFYGLRSNTEFFSQFFSVTAPPSEQRQIITENYSFGVDPHNVPRSEFVWFNYATNNSPAVFGIGNQATFQFGAFGDVPVGGDYDGDGLTDYTVFRPSNGTWYLSQSSNNQFRAFPFGQAGDKLVPADYDYDGITDFAVFRPSNGVWYISRSSDGGFRAVQFGAGEDVPITGDFDGDGRADFTVFRPSSGVWYSLKTTEGFSAAAFGISSDQPVPGDFDGDGRHDIAVFRAGIWYLNQSRDGLRSVQWGLPGDVPVTVRY